jgi:ribosomal protein S18 acetylase RimI-like enzyme
LASDVSLERVEAERVVEELLGQVVDVWSAAHGLSSASATRREFGVTRIPRHVRRDGFLFVGAFAPGDRLVGFVYGYAGAPGQWWHDKVAAALDQDRREVWVDPPHFELTEIAVDPPYQGRGIGSMLHDAVLADLPYERALLSALADNAPVLRFYERRGWQVLLDELRFEPGRPVFSILGKELRQ